MNMKYQIFVSSTYEDLRSEREQVVKAILEMGHIPVGMEMFSAADEEQWKLIARTIDEIDYYVVIVAHRYGSTVGGVSYTEKEYDYAISSGIPTLGFIIEGAARWPVDRIDTTPEATASLQKFKDKVRRKLVSSWKSAEDLHGKVSIALMKQMNTNPRTGWVPASEVIAPAVTAELTRLSSENAELRVRLAALAKTTMKDKKDERKRTLAALGKNKVRVTFFYSDGVDWEDLREVSLHTIFSLIAPEMLIEKSLNAAAGFFGTMLNKSQRTLRSPYAVPLNWVKTWIADLVTLELVGPSPKKHHVRDAEEYWTLTSKGRDLLTHINRARLYAGLDSTEKTPESATGVSPHTPTKKSIPPKKAATKSRKK